MRLLLLDPPEALVVELSRRDHDLLVVDRWVSPLARQLGGPRHEFVKLVSTQKISFSAIKQVRAMIRRFRPEVIHAFRPDSLSHALIGSWGMKTPPSIVSYRGITRVPNRLDPGDWISYLSKRVSAHACESEAVKQAMVEGGIPKEKCTVVYNCVTSSEPAGSAELRSQLNIPADAFVVGTVASIRPIKGVDILLKAAAECASLPDIYFLIVGECNDPAVEKLARDPRLHNRLKMTGRLPEARRMMTVFDIFVMPSRQEALCRALLEAMVEAVCPIVSDAGGMKEIVRHGRDGLVFPTENVQGLSENINRLYEDRKLLAALGQSAQERVRDVCSSARFADRLEAVYQTALGNSAKPSRRGGASDASPQPALPIKRYAPSTKAIR
ncbi:MAG: glycosyltransferase family 4 protein [Acidobacteria bacterium]|nr:glycosyltransferase family 4 protein [Acidobacteriota bacterium]